MFSSIYEWLWPLFVPCTGEQALAINLAMPLHIRDQLGNTLYNSFGYPVPLTACVCPTPAMHVLLVLAIVGIVACAFSLVSGLLDLFRPKDRRTDRVLRRFIDDLDRASDDYLRRV